jgi:hypothetical protein
MDSADDGDRPSITETNGTVARFEMAYNPNPGERFAFGPTWAQRIPSFVFLAFACVVMWLAHTRPVGHPFLAWIILLAAIGFVVQSSLRGVIVTRDGVEARYLVALSVGKVKKWGWAQIDRLILEPKGGVLLELWDGSYEKLPPVRDGAGLVDILARVATGRGRPITRLEKKV